MPVLVLVAVLGLIGGAGCAQTLDAQSLDAQSLGDTASHAGAWRHSSLWDDGNAEFCAYRVEWAHYRGSYPGRALLILVKEPWAPDLDVKADRPRPDGFDVLKLNHVRDVATGIYTYHQMVSVYLRRDSAEIVKIASTSSEACGVSTALMEHGSLQAHTYFDGVADRTLGYPPGTLPEDGLPALLRDWVEGEIPATVQVMPTLMDGRLADLAPVTYRVSRGEVEPVEVPAGVFQGVELRLEPIRTSDEDGGDGRSYVFEVAEPHRLLEIEDDAGTRYRMARCGRIPYWTMNKPGGEDWLPEEVRR